MEMEMENGMKVVLQGVLPGLELVTVTVTVTVRVREIYLRLYDEFLET